MKISDILRQNEVTLSFEVFPPKTDAAFEEVLQATEEIAALKPSFISVTYGAGGKGGKYTMEIARRLQNTDGVETLAHLTCVGAGRDEVHAYLQAMKDAGIHNIMALRGDLPEGMSPETMKNSPYPHAYDLIREIRSAGDFCIGAACYPEGHIECPHREDDIAHLKEKVDRGVDFLTTQMFFDNSVLYSFLYRAMARGIEVPVIAGIMPVTNGKMIARACALSGATLPNRFRRIVDRYGDDPDAMKQAGIAYATEQIVDLLANGVRGIHVYTMNKPDVARAISENLSHLIAGV